MRYVKYLALLAVLMVPLAYSQAQVRVGIAVGPGYVAGPPVCAYGYYNYYPYACAPYGYYGPDWFVSGVFIGAGPWYHWGHPAVFWNRGYRGWYGREGWRGDRFDHRGWGYAHNGYARGGYGRGDVHGYSGGGYHGGQAFRGGGEFHGREAIHGGGGFRGEGGFHGGGRR